MCSNGRCIAHSFLCDSTLVNNCGDFSDNSKGPPANCTGSDMYLDPFQTLIRN